MKIAYVMLSFGEQIGIFNKINDYARMSSEKKLGVDYFWFPNETVAVKFSELTFTKNFHIKGVSGGYFKKRMAQKRFLDEILSLYDQVIIRYPLFDPVLFFVKEHEKIIFEHHTIEVDELRHKKDPRIFTELLFSKFWFKKVKGYIGVTNEILAYHSSNYPENTWSSIMPNSIDYSRNCYSDDVSSSEVVNLVFAANFRSWHGIEKIHELISILNNSFRSYKIYVVGTGLTHSQKNILKRFSCVEILEGLSSEGLSELMGKCQFGIDSLNVSCKGLSETCSLKVRSYLSHGLMVISGTNDSALTSDFPYYYNMKRGALHTWLKEVSGTSKDVVRSSSQKLVDSHMCWSRLIDSINDL